MVSFSCNACQDTLKKPKLVQHFQRCHAPFTCLDCNKEMWDGEFQKHTTCISEAEKYEKTLYKGDKKKGKGQQQQQQKQNGNPQQQQQKSAQPTEETPAPAAVPSAPSTSATSTNGAAAAAGAVPVDSSAIAAEAKAGPSDAAESTTGKKDKKRKRRSEAAKSAVTDTGSTSDAQVAKALVADPPVEKTEATVEAPAAVASETKLSLIACKSDEKKSRKRHKKDKSQATAAVNGDTSAMQGDKPLENGVADSTAAPVKVDLKDTLTSKVPEKGQSISLADALAGLPADKIQEALAGLRVQRGKKDKFELSVGYA